MVNVINRGFLGVHLSPRKGILLPWEADYLAGRQLPTPTSEFRSPHPFAGLSFCTQRMDPLGFLQVL